MRTKQMKFDEIATKMLNAFITNDELTSTDITKIIFNPRNRDISIKKNNLIIHRLKNWVKSGIIINGTIKNKVAHYHLNSNKIKIGQLLLEIDDNIEKLGYALIIDIKDEPLIVKILDEV